MSAAALAPFAPDIFSGEGADTRLLGSRCPTCGRCFFPPCAICPDDGDATQSVALAREGRLYSFTVVRMKPPFDLPAPYAVGYVDLADGGPRVFALLDPALAERCAIGMPLVLTSGPMGSDLDGAPCTRPFFTAEQR